MRYMSLRTLAVLAVGTAASEPYAATLAAVLAIIFDRAGTVSAWGARFSTVVVRI